MVQLLCRSKFQRGMGHGEKEKKPRFFINDNTDILMEILKRLDGRSLGVAACVCRLWRSVTWNDSLWEHLCFRHVSPPPPGVRPVVVALGGYRRLYMMCLRPVLSRLGQMKRGLGGSGGGGDSDLVGRVWTRDSVQLSLSLFCVDYYERLDGRLVGTPIIPTWLHFTSHTPYLKNKQQ
ncbi:F-box protein SNE [Vitis vinifera]|uniref:F-box protein SNE n=1 Tax=Vitis vinifera TaxID=29760 RepID=A0A438IEB0_VITVI|nr:F-box protein SNE [Vitis vinifera]RVW95090.1 F-box protein SNE [Vitis vinifera]